MSVTARVIAVVVVVIVNKSTDEGPIIRNHIINRPL